MAISEEERAQKREEYRQFEAWVNAELETWGNLVKPYYTPKGLDHIKYQMKEAFCRPSGEFNFVYSGRVYYAGVSALAVDDLSTKKEHIQGFLRQMNDMLHGLGKGDYDAARGAYNEALGDFGKEGGTGIKGKDFLIQHVIPGSKVEGFVELIKDEVKKAYEGYMSKNNGDLEPEEIKAFAEEKCLAMISNVQGVEASNKIQVLIEEKGSEILANYLGQEQTKAVENQGVEKE